MPEPTSANADALTDSLDALSHPYRRWMLTLLNDRNPRDEDEFSTFTRGGDDADGPGQLSVELHHSHLPKLADSGFVDWDREENVVTRGPRFDEVAPLIELMENHRDELPAGWP